MPVHKSEQSWSLPRTGKSSKAGRRISMGLRNTEPIQPIKPSALGLGSAGVRPLAA